MEFEISTYIQPISPKMHSVLWNILDCSNFGMKTKSLKNLQEIEISI